MWFLNLKIGTKTNLMCEPGNSILCDKSGAGGYPPRASIKHSQESMKSLAPKQYEASKNLDTGFDHSDFAASLNFVVRAKVQCS